MANLKELNAKARELREKDPGLTWKEAQKKAAELLNGKSKNVQAAPLHSWCTSIK